MCSDYLAKSRSNSEVREIAKRARRSFALLGDDQRVDLVATLRQKEILTCYGVKRLTFSTFDSLDLHEEGKTQYHPGLVEISLSSKVFERLQFGEGRARNTASHEIGHAVMHEGATLFRKAGVQVSWIEPFRSAEHQTKIFAPAFLIDDDVAATLENASEISVRFGVSLESAEIYFKELRRPGEKRALARKLAMLSKEMDASSQSTPGLKYLTDPCPGCGQAKLFPVGSKYMCQGCDRVFDRFQDGDRIE